MLVNSEPHATEHFSSSWLLYGTRNSHHLWVWASYFIDRVRHVKDLCLFRIKTSNWAQLAVAWLLKCKPRAHDIFDVTNCTLVLNVRWFEEKMFVCVVIYSIKMLPGVIMLKPLPKLNLDHWFLFPYNFLFSKEEQINFHFSVYQKKHSLVTLYTCLHDNILTEDL